MQIWRAVTSFLLHPLEGFTDLFASGGCGFRRYREGTRATRVLARSEGMKRDAPTHPVHPDKTRIKFMLKLCPGRVFHT